MIVNDVAEKEEKFCEEESESKTDGQSGGETAKEEFEAKEEDEHEQNENKVLSFEDWFQSFADYRLDQGMIQGPTVQNSDVVEGGKEDENVENDATEDAKEAESDFFDTSLKEDIVEEQVKNEDDKTGNTNVSMKSVAYMWT